MDDFNPQGSHAHLPEHELAHEHSDVSVRGIFIFAGALFLLTVVVHVVLGVFMERFANRAKETQEARDERYADTKNQFPRPRLQSAPRLDMEDLRAEEQAILNEYDWVDREAGIARIPIDRAMQLLARKGLPARDAAKASAPQPKSEPAPKREP